MPLSKLAPGEDVQYRNELAIKSRSSCVRIDSADIKCQVQSKLNLSAKEGQIYQLNDAYRGAPLRNLTATAAQP